MLTPRRRSFYGRYSYRLQLPAEILVALGSETALLGQFILARMFQPGEVGITLMFALNHISFFLSPYLAEQMRGRRSRPFFTLMLALAPTAFLAAFFARGYWGLGPLLVVANTAFITLFVPLRNRLLHSNYRGGERGECYGLCRRSAVSVYFGLILLAALALERDRTHIHWMLPLAGVLSAAGILLYRRIRIRGEQRLTRTEAGRSSRSPLRVYRELIRLFVQDRPFLLFQIGFLAYGMGFMFTMPQEIKAVSRTLELSYTAIVIGIYGLTPLLKIIFLPTFGRLLDRAGPCRASATAFACLMAYPLSVWTAVQLESPLVWFLARACFGAAMAGVELVWTIGAASFGDTARAPAYSAAHIFTVGVRGVMWPFLGLGVAAVFGTGVFLLGALMLGLAAGWMMWIGRRGRRMGAAVNRPMSAGS